MRKFKTEINPWTTAMQGTRKTVKRPNTIHVLCVTRNKNRKIIKTEIKKHRIMQ